ncbi:MAG TPA: response regulator [Candidatus Deferrimicrobium sp.]|nr:response regulator [Candidatus Deferrimicrobium sp.]
MKASRLVILLVLAAVFAAMLGFSPAVAAAPPSSVLILNSYDQGYSWTDGEVAGIRSVLGDSPSWVQLSVEYLDWRRFPSQQNHDQVEKLLQTRYGASKPDVLIVTDNPALDFALDHRSSLFAGVPIVFCGINDYQASLLRGAKDVTGVAEEIDPAGTLRLALRLHAHANNVYVITDFTETGTTVRQTIQSVVPEFQDRAAFTFSPDATVAELMDAVAALPGNTVILAGPFTRDKSDVLIDIPEFTAELAQHTNLPIYGMYEQCLGQGIVGGVLTSPQLEGEQAGKLVARILAGEPAGSIPVVTQRSTLVAFDWDRLKAFGIPMSSLPVGATVINRPVTILDTNRRLVVLTIVIMLLLVFGIVFLAINDVRRERAEARALRLATAIEQAAEAIAITDPSGIVTYINPAFEHATGFPDAEIRGHNIRGLLGDEVALPLERRTEEHLNIYDSWKKKITSVRKDGSLVELDLTVSPVRGPGDEVANYTYVGRDITQEAALEEQLRQSQKLEGIGLLAGGVAHDFNNILTGILGYANMLEPDAAPGSTMQEGLHVIQQAAERAAELTKQLLSFARRGKRQNTTVDLNSTILEVVSLLTRTVNKNISVTEHFDTDPATVLGDPGQLQQVVLNLAINGRDAMPQGGSLAFRTWRQRFSAEQVMAHPGAEPGMFVALSVSDTGVGIEKKNLRRIFEPFFTTKDVDKGTGMGLAIAYGIVKAHKGFINVESDIGKGTTFTVYVPATEVIPATAHAAVLPRKGHGRILIVDDEEVVRKLAREMLHRAGYDVVTAIGTTEAVAWYHAHPHEADLVIIDMVMPGKDGQECFKALKAIDPDVRAILSTGYGLDGHAQDTLDAGMVGYVQKPYHMEDLVTAVADALADDQPS